VGNHLPNGTASDPRQSAAITLINLEERERTAEVRLPAGSSCVREVAISPDGSRAYVVHTIGRANLPTTQIERGWVNTNGLSVIDLKPPRRIATLLLDSLLEGAADPWGIAIAPNGNHLWVTIAGTHQLATIDLLGLSALLAEQPDKLEDDMAALARAGVIRRTPLPGNGPRGLAVSPDGTVLAVAMYFSGDVALLDAQTARPRVVIPLGVHPEPDAIRRGERIFHDATYVKQGWLTCATCHPDGRADGMNWDLLNDGLGNPKNGLSLVWSHKTPPAMARRGRASMEVASAAGFQHIAHHKIGEAELEDVQAYLRSLEPAESPSACSDGPCAEQIERGREVFHRDRVACARCHPAELYTDLKEYDVGTRGELDRSGTFDTPTLVELWRTAPYLHDGSAATLREVLIECNRDDRHGVTSHLTDGEIDDLIAYLMSL
jgi:mono/diheme cytochrome c family protein